MTARDTFLRYRIYQVLRQDGHTVLPVGDQAATLSLSDTHTSEIHLIITVHEPPILDSVELHRQILRVRPDVKRLILAHGSIGDHSFDSIPVLHMPFASADLRRIVSNILDPESNDSDRFANNEA